ncbi:hypothetical protein MASR1M32_30590 [Rhodobacter sp.]
MSQDYVGNLPLYVTENGMANADLVEDGAVTDGIRTEFLFSHLGAARDAIAGGANVKGFFYWSLLDNYEWAEGYQKRFGLVHVDFDSLKRTPKSSYHALARAHARNDARGPKMSFALLADIGGTNTRVALARGTTVLTETSRRFPNAEYKARGQHIAQILRDYLSTCGEAVRGVCVAAAGPVQDGVATMTNLDWTMDAAAAVRRPPGRGRWRS